MNLIIIGCEYTGKTTLTEGIGEWMVSSMGARHLGFHDHFLPWHPSEGGDSADKVAMELKLLTLNDASLLEQFCRYILHYHTHPALYSDPDHNLVNWYYGDAVYGPLYYGFGGPGQPADRQVMARSYDAMVTNAAPDTVLVLLKATPEVIRKRREADPNPQPYPHDEHIELVLRRFEEEFQRSLIRRKIALDTSEATAEETLNDFLRQVKPLLTSDDRLRILAHRDS
jgi:hypothetical protein